MNDHEVNRNDDDSLDVNSLDINGIDDTSDALHYDIIIVGGGMAGATAALALSQLDLSIALVESIAPQQDISPSFDQRAVALSAASIEIYKSLNLWQTLKPLACPITDIFVSDQGHFGATRLHAKDYNIDALGAVIPLDQTGPLLWQRIEQCHNIETFCPYKVQKLQTKGSQNNLVRLKIMSSAKSESKKIADKTMTAKLLLAADGTFSSVAQNLGVEVERNCYRQHALITNISTEKKHLNRAFERFTSNGPLALLPLTQNRMSLVWCHQTEDIDQVMQLDDQEFIHQLQQAFGFRLGKISKVGVRNQYPLALHLAKQNFSERVLLLGNSAHTLHPIAGQGFNLGLRDIAALYDAIEQAKKANLDIGSEVFLSAYHLQRQPDWKRTIGATNKLVRLFSNDFLPAVMFRNKALFMLDKLPFVKQQLAMAAMGFSGESARLTRGVKE